MVMVRTPSVIRSEAPHAACCQLGYGDIAKLKIVTVKLAVGRLSEVGQ
jgi:hypothetical protein